MPRTTDGCGHGLDVTEPPSPAAPRGPRSSSLPAPPRARPSTTAARAVQPSVRIHDVFGGEEPCDDLDACSVDHNHRVRKKAAWIGDMHFGFGFKWAIVEHLYHYRGSQALGSHYDQVHSGAMMIVTEDVSSRSNRYVSVIAWRDFSFDPALFIFQIINIPIAFLLA
ncbi:hypothetical protein ZWY2020_051953 [Hordeum vulgare]|nr:hypothetical protein ZWY2020_051953 [Hordeum vulgare]